MARVHTVFGLGLICPQDLLGCPHLSFAPSLLRVPVELRNTYQAPSLRRRLECRQISMISKKLKRPLRRLLPYRLLRRLQARGSSVVRERESILDDRHWDLELRHLGATFQRKQPMANNRPGPTVFLTTFLFIFPAPAFGRSRIRL